MNQLQVPSKIRLLIDNKPFIVDDIGMSGNQVLIFEDMVLKIEDNPTSMAQQVQVMQWLEGKISVPQVLAYEEKNGKCYLLMSKIGGEMSCSTYYLEHPNILLKTLACGLKMLWGVDVRECPRVRDLDAMLKEARMQVENNLVDLDHVEPTTFGKDGFESTKHLLEWLESGQIKGFIDLDKAGIGDKWNDIALCYRSLKHNFDGTYGGKVYEDFNPDMLFEALGIEPNWEKINYYLLLDELF